MMGTTTSTESSAVTTGDPRPSTTREILVAARKLIEKPENWCQADYALDKTGKSVSCFADEGPDACAFCSSGAIFRVAIDSPLLPDARMALVQAMDADIAYFNDKHTHAEVLAAFDRAIAKLSDHQSDASEPQEGVVHK